MNIHLRPDQELKIQEAIKSGLISNEIDILDIGLDILFKTNKEESKAEVINKISNFGKKHNISSGESPIKDLISEGSNRTPQEAEKHILELRKGNYLPDGITIYDLINEGRA
jgi:hypothetical protein